jgi:hypothetical protein
MESIISLLKAKPDRDELTKALADVKESLPHCRPVELLNLYSTLVGTTLPDLGYDPPDDITQLMVHILGSVQGLNMLVSRTNALATDVLSEESKLKDKGRILSHIVLYGWTIGLIAHNGVLSSIILQPGANEREIASLFAGSRLLTCMSVAASALKKLRHQLSHEDVQMSSKWVWLSDGIAYSEFLGLEICQACRAVTAAQAPRILDTLAVILDKAMKLGYPQVIGEIMLTRDHVEGSVEMFSRMRSTQQWHCFSKSLLPVLQRRLAADEHKIGPVASIISLFKFHSTPESVYTHATSFSVSQYMRRALVLLAREHAFVEKQFRNELRHWGGTVNISHTPLIMQEAQTELLVFSMKFLSTNFIRDMGRSPDYLNAISNRLSASSDKARLYGIVFAEKFSAYSGDAKPLQFGIEGSYDAHFREWISTLDNSNDRLIAYSSDIWDQLDCVRPPDVQEPDSDVEKVVREEPQDIKEPMDEFKGADSDDDDLVAYALPEDDVEDSDDDPDVATKPKIQPPVYIRDLLSYLNAEDSYDKQLLGVTHGARLIRQKVKFGQELTVHAKELATTLAGMHNSFDIDNFDNLRLSVMTALVASAPETVPAYLAQLLLSADYSLQQRISVLSGIVLGARELAGLQDVDANAAPSFPSKMLPPNVHERFMPSQVDAIADHLEKQLLIDTATDAAESEQISGPKVLRMSRRLEKARENGPKIITNKYAKLASRYFFGPLLSQWYAYGGFQDLGTHSTIFVAHFFKSLALLLSSAHPTSNELFQMSADLLGLCMEARATQHMPVIESILISILVILDINESEAIVNQWPRQIVELREWINDTMELIPDEKVRALAGGVLYRLLDIIQQWERRLISEEQSLGMSY